MTSADDGDRTVFRPNPGGRKPPGPDANAPPAPQPRAPAYNPNNAPAYGARPPPPPSMHPVRNDDWIASNAPAQTSSSALPSAQDLRFDDLAAPNANPLMRSAGPLLLLLGRLRVAALQASFASLMEQVAEAIKFFEKDIRAAGVEGDESNAAKYLICATADDIVQNIPTDDRHVWTQYSMLSRFFGERIGGVRFFEELDRMLVDPAAHYDVLELQHACFALGFQGRYRSDPNGQSTLQMRQRNLYETLRRIRARSTNALSPNWKGQDLAAKGRRWRIPAWAVVAIVLCLALGVFLLLRMWLISTTDAVAAETHALHPSTPISLQRRIWAPPPAIEASPKQVSQLERIRAAFGPEISAGTIAVEAQGKWIVIRVGNLILFNSGQANVLPQFMPVAKKISEIIDHEPGAVRIIGHTDNVRISSGSRFASNFDLSVARAKAVAEIIKPAISGPDRLGLDGKGPDVPIASNDTTDGRAKNRRVEVLITRTE